MSNLSGILRKSISVVLMFALMVLAVACSSNTEETTTTDAAASNVAINETIVDSIRDRGYINVGCKMDVPDLGYYDSETDTWSGLEVELAYEVAANIWGTDVAGAKADDRVHFVGVTVADREETLTSGAIDLMIATYTITDERATRFAISDSYYTDYVGIMVRDYGYDDNSLGSVGIRSIADLDGKYIGVPRNATTRDAFINYTTTMSTISVSPIFCELDSYEALHTALLNGNIDAMSVDVSILNGYLDANTMILPERFAAQHYGAAATLENVRLIEIVNQVIAE